MVGLKKKSKRWSIKSLLVLLLTTTTFPANYAGVSLLLGQPESSSREPQNIVVDEPKLNSPLVPFQSRKNDEAWKVSESVAYQRTEPKMMLAISRPILYWTIVVPIASFILIGIILGHLCDQPMNKQCLVNLLYRDVLRINITHVCLWSLAIFYCEYQGQIPFGEKGAQIIAYLNQILALLILAYLNTIGILRLCTARLKQVDLAIPLLGECDEVALRNIRCGIYSVMLFVVGTQVCFSAMPPAYYPLSNGLKVHVNELSTGSIIVLAFQFLLLSLCAIFHLGAKIYMVKERMKMHPIILRRGRKIKGEQENGSIDIEQHEATIKELSRKYGFIVPILPNVAMMIGLAVVISLHYFHPSKQEYGENNVSFWHIVSITIGFEGVFFPSWLIFRNRNLRSYAKRHVARILTKLLSNVSKLSYVIPHVKRQNIVTPK